MPTYLRPEPTSPFPVASPKTKETIMTTRHAKIPTGQLSQANLFDVTGPIRINFARSSITGQPQLSYQDAELKLSFQGDELDIVTTPIGDLVTVTVQSIPDALVRRISLLVPVVHLPAGEQADFETIVIETVDRSGAFVPRPGPAGVLQSYRVHQVQATAQHVNF
jgi:hypothetical protein